MILAGHRNTSRTPNAHETHTDQIYTPGMARGSVFKRNGRYGIRVDLGPDPRTGVRRQTSRQGFRTKKEAEHALDEALTSLRNGTMVGRTSMTVAEYLDDWLEGERLRLKETTWSSYETAIARIKANIGSLRVQNLTPRDVERLYLELAQSGGRGGKALATKTVRNTHVVLRKALADAERLGLLGRNPATVARPPIPQRQEQQTWTSEDLRTFFASIADDRLQSLYVLLATTGMRRGEALGLRWRDVDLDARELHVVQTLTTVRYTPVFSTPKTKRSRRIVYLDVQTVAALRARRRLQREERLRAGDAWDSSLDLVFTDELGRPVHPDRITREFGAKAKAAGLAQIRLHDLRHTYATLALKAGVHPKIVSDRLGHATVGVTLDLYSHVSPALGRDAADSIAATIFG